MCSAASSASRSSPQAIGRRRKDSLANGERIGQALSGAGIADLYASLFVATTLYHLLSPAAGFVGLGRGDRGRGRAFLAPRRADRGAGVGRRIPDAAPDRSDRAQRAAAVRLSLLSARGVPCGDQEEGLVAPRHPDGRCRPLAGLSSGCRAVFDPRDAIWPLLFVMAVSATVAFAPVPVGDRRAEQLRRSHQSDFAAALHIARRRHLFSPAAWPAFGGFELSDWALFGLLTAGVIALAALKPRIYNFAPLAALVMSFAMFVVWGVKDARPADIRTHDRRVRPSPLRQRLCLDVAFADQGDLGLP